MMIIMRTSASQEQIDAVIDTLQTIGLKAHLSVGEERTVIGAIGDGRPVNTATFAYLPGVDRVVPITRHYKLASREFIPDNSSFNLDGIQVGGHGIVIIAGPCSAESRSQLMEGAWAVREAGAR